MVQRMDSVESVSLRNRYTDAYTVARVTVAVGKLFKGVGMVIAALVIIGAAIAGAKLGYAASDAPYPAHGDEGTGVLIGFACFIGGIVTASFSGGILYLLGILISAQGQTLKATLDVAINSSAFLTHEQRAEIMSLR